MTMKIDEQRAAGYTRVSTVEQSMSDKPSLEQQRARIEATCGAQDFDLVQVYQDVNIGAKSDRPGLKQMLEDAKAGHFGRLVFLKTDRLGRNLKDLLDISDALRDAGIDLVSVVEGFDTRTAVGRMFFQFLGMFAEFERETIKQRPAGGCVGKMQHGAYMPSIAPYGYQIDRKSKTLAAHPEHAPVVRDIYKWAARENLGAPAIAKRLNERSVPIRRTQSTSCTARSTAGTSRSSTG